MDDEVLELKRKSAEALGYSVSRAKYQPHGQVWVTPPHDEQSLPSSFLWNPTTDSTQAFELLCWLAERGTVKFSVGPLGQFHFHPYIGREFISAVICPNPAELRLAIMRATVKVHEGSKP